jgi:hypothetical protein
VAGTEASMVFRTSRGSRRRSSPFSSIRPKAPRCKAPMKDVVWIAPVQDDPGLIAYECLSCGYVTSVLISPQSGDQSKGGQST